MRYYCVSSMVGKIPIFNFLSEFFSEIFYMIKNDPSSMSNFPDDKNHWDIYWKDKSHAFLTY